MKAVSSLVSTFYCNKMRYIKSLSFSVMNAVVNVFKHIVLMMALPIRLENSGILTETSVMSTAVRLEMMCSPLLHLKRTALTLIQNVLRKKFTWMKTDVVVCVE